jgi:isoquinoline 1-oxidoreductase subunit beta
MNKLRRFFLISAAVVGGGVAIGVGYVNNKLGKDGAFKLPVQPGEGSFGAWLTIGKDGMVSVAVPNQEMGQGIYSTFAMLVAEELDADPTKVKVMQAPIQAVYANTVMLLDGLPFKPHDQGPIASGAKWTMDKVLRAVGIMATGGSTSTRNSYAAVRQSAATARAMLVQAASTKMGKPVAELTTVAGFVVHLASNAKLSYGELAETASTIAATVAPLKPVEKFSLIGKGMARLDIPPKVDGSAQFGIDVRVEGQRFAAIKHCPMFGGTLKEASFTSTNKELQLVKGAAYVAVIGPTYWQAKQALAQVKTTWNDGPNATMSNASILEANKAALADPKALKEYESRGDANEKLDSLFKAATGKVSADYSVPFLAHATMEPLNATVQIKDGRCKVWAGNQAPTLVKWMAAGPAGVSSDMVEVETPYLGGGFGRRAEVDFIIEAVEIAKQANGAAVQTIWSREEDMQHDVYRPAAIAHFEAVLNDKGLPSAWYSKVAGPSVTKQFVTRLNPLMANDQPDKTNVEGTTFLPYMLPLMRADHAAVPVGVPVGFWRSVGHSFNAFFTESFVDECALAAKIDPIAYRKKLLADSADPQAKRFTALLDSVSNASGWGKPIEARPGVKVARGVAIAESFKSIVAEVAEIEVNAKNEVRVTKVWAAVDCGFCVDPTNTKAQISSGIIFGLTAALNGQIDIENGQVKQSNFGNYPLLNMAQSPEISVLIVNSGAEMGGIGEVGTPPIAPALANAIFAATGSRLRALPLKLS